MSRPRVVLYTRVGCHLCDEAELQLMEYGLIPEIVDVDASPTLRERFNTCVPVVEIDGAKVGTGKPGPVATRLREIYIDEMRKAAV